MVTTPEDEQLRLIEELRVMLAGCCVSAWDSDIRIQRTYPDPLYPITHTLTQTWYVRNRAEWEIRRPEIVRALQLVR